MWLPGTYQRSINLVLEKQEVLRLSLDSGHTLHANEHRCWKKLEEKASLTSARPPPHLFYILQTEQDQASGKQSEALAVA